MVKADRINRQPLPHVLPDVAPPEPGDDERLLIARAAGGDRDAFRRLVEQTRALVYRVALQYAGNAADAEDICQDVFVKLYQSLAGFRHEARFTSWLYRVTMNACIDRSRRWAANQAREQADDALREHAAGDLDPEQEAYGAELDAVLSRAVQSLPPRQRLVFVMRHYEQMKLAEIAAALSLQEGTVKRQLHAATRRLRHALRAVQVGTGRS
jgi:RNA polymerase sigma-70 factor (ECF subfamily)